MRYLIMVPSDDSEKGSHKTRRKCSRRWPSSTRKPPKAGVMIAGEELTRPPRGSSSRLAAEQQLTDGPVRRIQGSDRRILDHQGKVPGRRRSAG